MNEKQLKFSDDFKIRKITELVEVEYGDKISKIGREYGLNHEDNFQFFECGEFHEDDNGNNELDGFGICLFEEYLSMGNFEYADLNGLGRHIYHDGRILEGEFMNDELNG